jgi:dihydroflavonol-4-reductase
VRIYVTGATGYIGLALCRRLAADGHEVRALVRTTSAPAALDALREVGATLCPGDIRDRVSLREGMSGADWVIHAAADLDFGGPAERMSATNVSGSENVASLASKLGVGRLLAISSVATWGGSPDDGSPASEDTPRRTAHPTLYGATKAGGEVAIRDWAARGLRTNVVWPSVVYGPPGKKQGVNPVLRAMARGRYPALVGADRRTSWIFLEDLVDGIVRVMLQAPPGRDFLLAGDTADVREVAGLVCGAAGIRPPRLTLSLAVARLALALSKPWFRLRGRKPPIPDDHVANLACHWAFDDSRARRELAWSPRTLAVGLPPTLAYLLTPTSR